jgi:hypothetical protein
VWDAALARFGEEAIVDLVATCGYYGALGLVMNAARTNPWVRVFRAKPDTQRR